MSLYIDIDKVSSVLLADGWYSVFELSFDVDAYEYLQRTDNDPFKDKLLHGGGTGATWKLPTGERICCPIDSILAVREKPQVKDETRRNSS